MSLSAFVPKAFTPFQWAGMDPVPRLREKIAIVRRGLKGVPNLRIHADDPRRAVRQAILARGDRRVGDLLREVMASGGNWSRSIKESGLDMGFYVNRERPAGERFPWDFIDHGIRKSFLYKEYLKSLDEAASEPCPGESCSVCGVCDG